MPNTSQLDLELDAPEIAESCEVCSQDTDDCTCQTCSGCDERRESLCDHCEQCTDECCECSHCVRCSENVDADSICSLCSDRCIECCSQHSTCSRCNERVENICENCDHCEGGCCDCSYCEGCDHRHSNAVCDDCDHCPDCCNCGNAALLEGKLVFHSAKRNEYASNPSRRYISLEVEVARGDATELHCTALRYHDAIVEDGSLPSSGWELNMNPSQGDVFLRHVSEIASDLSDADAAVTSSCGMHCHVDARDFGWFDLFKLCKLYGKVEDGLFQIVAPSRRGNNYCKESASAYDFPNFRTFKVELLHRLYHWGTDSKQRRRCSLSYIDTESKHAHKNGHGERRIFQERTEKYNNSRYNALNLHSFFYRGTIEFRHHHGTTNAVKMQNWGMVCASILDAASVMTTAQLDALPMGGAAESLTALCAILRPELRAWVVEREESLRLRKPQSNS